MTISEILSENADVIIALVVTCSTLMLLYWW